MSRSRPPAPRSSPAKALRKKPAKKPARRRRRPAAVAKISFFQHLLRRCASLRLELPSGPRQWFSHLRAWLAVCGLVGLAACETTG
ncbi:MAG TPA: hypothetical protein VN229_24330, partial [Terriglobales bacterium]|nr:hypothetical protein [Terriglobales bacterium]